MGTGHRTAGAAVRPLGSGVGGSGTSVMACSQCEIIFIVLAAVDPERVHAEDVETRDLPLFGVVGLDPHREASGIVDDLAQDRERFKDARRSVRIDDDDPRRRGLDRPGGNHYLARTSSDDSRALRASPAGGKKRSNPSGCRPQPAPHVASSVPRTVRTANDRSTDAMTRLRTRGFPGEVFLSIMSQPVCASPCGEGGRRLEILGVKKQLCLKADPDVRSHRGPPSLVFLYCAQGHHACNPPPYDSPRSTYSTTGPALRPTIRAKSSR